MIVYVRVVDGELKKGQKIRFMGTDRDYQITDLGKLMPRPKQVDRIGTGEVGFLVAAIKDLHDVRIGDTVTDAVNPAAEQLPGYKPIQQMVYCDFYPGGKTQYDELRDAMDRLQLNDSSFTFRPGKLRRPGLRIPLRIPGSAAHGDHPGATGARVQHRSRTDRSDGDV